MKGDWFSWRSCGVGLLTGLGVAIAMAADAPNLAGNPVGRYQLHVWSHRGQDPGASWGGSAGRHGAYRIDTQTGEVFILLDDSPNAMKCDFSEPQPAPLPRRR